MALTNQQTAQRRIRLLQKMRRILSSIAQDSCDPVVNVCADIAVEHMTFLGDRLNELSIEEQTIEELSNVETESVND